MRFSVPITILKSNPVVTPVSLIPVNPSGILYLIGVRYSDGSTKLLSSPQLDKTFECDDDGTIYFDNHEDCNDTELKLSGDYPVPQGYELVAYRAYIDSCNLNQNIISGNLIMEIDGAIFKCEGWSKETEENFDEGMENFVLQTS